MNGRATRGVRAFRATLAALVLLGLLAGTPVLLAHWGHLDRSLTQPARWLRPDDGSVLVGLVTVLGWALWLVLAGMVVVEFWQQLRARRHGVKRSVPKGLLRPIVAGLVAMVVLMVPLRNQAMAQSVGPGEAASISAAAEAPGQVTTTDVGAPDASPGVERPGAEVGMLEAGPTTTVQPGEQLWDVADRTLGNPQRWTELVQLNQLDTSQLLGAGQVLHLPPDAAGAAALSQEQQKAHSDKGGSGVEAGSVRTRTVTVQRGDSLWVLAQRHLGDGDRWPQIVALNPIITEPDEIEIGWRLHVPVDQHADGVRVAEADRGVGARQDGQRRSGASQVHSSPRVERPVGDRSTVERSAGERSDDGAGDPGRSSSTRAQHPEAEPKVLPQPAPDQDATTTPATTGPLPPEPTNPPPPPPSQHSGEQTPGEQAPGEHSGGEHTSGPGTAVRTNDGFSLARQVTGGLCLVTAAGLLGGLAVRRRQQAAVRALGRLARPLSVESQQFEQGLGHLAAGASPRPVPTPEDPATVVIGWSGDEPVAVRLDDRRPTLVQGPSDAVSGFLGGVVTSLVSAEWSQGVDLVVVGDELAWTAQLDRPELVVVDLPEAITRWREASTQKRFSREPQQGWSRQVFVIDAALTAKDLDSFPACASMSLVARVDADPDAAAGDDAAPDLTPSVLLERVSDKRADSRPADVEPECVEPGYAGPDRNDPSIPSREQAGDAEVDGEGIDPVMTARWCRPTMVLVPEALGEFTPQLVSRPARRALVDLHTCAAGEPDVPARWWHHDPGGGANGTAKDPPLIFGRTPPILPTTDQRGAAMDHPQLQLLGPVRIHGARGTEPSRSTRQCAECCAWILQHPGRSSLAMASGLVIAESTRRSHVSRLRSWLGQDEDGRPYLPEAYTGRIALNPDVDSDWEQFQALTAAGIDRTPSQSLVDALSLVRGRPMADVAPMQWGWASGLQAEMTAAVRDASVVLATRSLDQSDLATAEWAIDQGLMAQPEDELLLALRLRLLLRRGESGAERLVMQITRNARELGVDLHDSTIEVLQDAVSRQPRLEA